MTTQALIKQLAQSVSGVVVLIMTSAALLLATLVVVLLVSRGRSQSTPSFADVTSSAGLGSQRKLKKYGGPTLADIDNDGFLDLLFNHHDAAHMEVWFNKGGLSFSKSSWYMFDDMHAIVAAPISASSREVRFTVSRGGNYGKNPAYARVFSVNRSSRAINEVTQQVGMDKNGGRGRTALFLSMSGPSSRSHGNLDVMYSNAIPAESGMAQYWAYENVGGGNFDYKTLSGYNPPNTELLMATDIDGDGIMEIVSYAAFTVHKQVGAFALSDITSQVVPGSVEKVGVTAVAELDYNGDGLFDLYLTRARPKWFKKAGFSFNDILLENQNGKYVDVSGKAGIPGGGDHRGVTVGDFNNDGFIDIIVFQYSSPDFMLLNDGSGGFKKVGSPISRPSGVSGDMGMAADIDMDGRIDLVVSQGDHDNAGLGGTYKVLKNVTPDAGNYLLVHVGHASDGSATSLYAVVTVSVDGKKMYRRVGSPGSQVSRSFIEVLHFGLGSASSVTSVTVKWTSGTTEKKSGVEANSKVNFGVI